MQHSASGNGVYEAESASSDSSSTTSASAECKLSTTSSVSENSSSSRHLPSSKPHGPSNDPCWNAIREIQSRARMPNFNDLCFIERLGSGDIGTVYLVELKASNNRGCVFAAKVMDREELVRRQKESRAKIEKEILEMLKHPFLPTLYASIESSKWSCLLTEFCPGGDLHVLRQRQPERRFDEADVRFYASEVVAALEYLHMMGIIYRDLKPENVLVRSDGHVMLTDFDLSLKCADSTTSMAHIVYDLQSLDLHQAVEDYNPKNRRPQNPTSSSSCTLPNCINPAISCFRPMIRLPRRRPTHHHRHHRGSLKVVAEPVDARSMSFVGTYEYLAPEIASGEGHGSAVDWWTLGVFMFEMLYGVTPFRGLDNEHTMANIMARALEFPKEPTTLSSSAKDLISLLLIKDPAKRMGSLMGATAIKNHPFFHGVNWALLRCTTPPYVPKAGEIRDLASSYDNNLYDDGPVEYF